MVAGQSADLSNEQSTNWDPEVLSYIHQHKTGSLLTASILAGAKAGGAEEALLHALQNYGYAYGELFQITDDILDVTGDFSHMGKTLGKDAKAEKLTYVTLYGLDTARVMAKQAADRAAEALTDYPQAEFFLALADYTLTRDS